MASDRKSYAKGQRDGSRNVYKPTGKNSTWAGITGWTKGDADDKRSYDKGYRNGRKDPKRG